MALPDRPKFGLNQTPTRGIPTPPPTPPVRPGWGHQNNDFQLSGGSDGEDLIEEETYDDYEEVQPSNEHEYHNDPAPANTWTDHNETYQEGGEGWVDEDDLEDDELEDELQSLSPEVQHSVELLIQEILSDDSSEVIMNSPYSIHCKRNGQRFHLTNIDFVDAKTYHHVINKFILEFTDTTDRITDSAYLVEGQLELAHSDDPDAVPMVARVHVLAPPAVKYAKVTIAKKSRTQFTIDDIWQRGAMSENMKDFVKAIVRGKLTTIFSGLSGSGKTTLLEACSNEFDKDDRVIVAEDTSELDFQIPDVAYMVANKPRPGQEAQKAITLEWLVAQANRMRPDRIIIGETRGAEMAEFLIAANSGADGSMTTLHAQDPERALTKIANLAGKASENRNESSIMRDIASTVHIIIQMALIDNKHIITHITEVSDTVTGATNRIQIQPIFQYDRATGEHKAVGRPSENLRSFLSARGVNVQSLWFQRS